MFKKYNEVQFTEGLVNAIILNRTFLLSKNIHMNCYDNIIRLPWIADQESIQEFAKRSNCSYANDNVFDYSGAQIGYLQKKPVGEDYDYSCYLDRSNVTRLSFGPFELLNIFSDAKINGILLGKEAQRRVEIIYSHPNPYLSRFEAAGYAFRKIISFSNKIKNHTWHILHKLSNYSSLSGSNASNEVFRFPYNTITVAMHIRHADHLESRTDYRLTTKYDIEFLSILDDILRQPRLRGKQCRLLIASDRIQTVRLITKQAARRLNCSVYTSPKRFTDDVNLTLCGDSRRCVEHGPWSNHPLNRDTLSQMSDIHLLSHAQYFIGTGRRNLFKDDGSSYSRLIAGLVADTMLRRLPQNKDNFINYTDFYYPNRPGACPAEARIRLEGWSSKAMSG